MLEPFFMDKVDNERSGHGKGNKDNEPESIRFSVEGEIIVFKVHPIGREDHGWDGHDDGHHGQGFHDIVLVVGDDRCEGIGHRMENVSINIRHLNGLLGLDQGIFQQVLVFQVFLDVTSGTGQFLDHTLIGF